MLVIMSLLLFMCVIFLLCFSPYKVMLKLRKVLLLSSLSLSEELIHMAQGFSLTDGIVPNPTTVEKM